jgi:hypothetical protein
VAAAMAATTSAPDATLKAAAAVGKSNRRGRLAKS